MIFFNTFKSILKSIVDMNEADDLKAVGTSWLIARLVASGLNSEATISAKRLLGIGLAERYIHIPDITTPIVSEIFLCHQSNRLPVISANVKEFARQFNKKVLMWDEQPCKIFLSAAGQQYDLMLVYLAKDKPFVLFIDFKNKQIAEPPTVKNVSPVEFTPDFEQFHEVKKAITELVALGETEKLSPVSQALVDGNYAFVLYATTHSNVTQADDSKVYVANNEEMMGFTSILKPFYESLRAVHD